MNHAESLSEEATWHAVAARDVYFDGRFVFAVATTGIYCRPSCPARRPRRENVRFFASSADARAAGFRPCKRCCPDETSREEAAIAAALALLHECEGSVTLAQLGERVGYSAAHFQRLFRRTVGLSPAAYQRALRLERARDALSAGEAVTQVIYAAGYGAASRFYEGGKERLGMKPSAWRDGGRGIVIGWAVIETTLGSLLVAATDKGVCRISFGEGREELAARFPHAELVEAGKDFATMLSNVAKAVERPGTVHDIPLDVRGTAFQEAVWEELRRIPPGETRTYAQIAAAIGRPGAVRAAGSANGANPVAVLIPCHRVVRADGSLGGYAYGEAIKRELLGREAGSKVPAEPESP